jgi:hypothetical protein
MKAILTQAGGKAPSVFRSAWNIAALLAMILFITGAARAQDMLITDSTSVSGNGVIRLRGNLVDSSRITAKTIGGIINLLGTSTQAIGVGYNSGLTVDSLDMNGTAAQLGQNLTVDSLAVASGTFTVNNKNLTILGKTGHSGGSFVADSTSDLVTYGASSGSQSVIDGIYKSLTLSGSSTKNLLGNVTATNVSHTGGNLTVNDSVTVVASGKFSTISNFTGTAALLFQGGTDTIAAVSNIASSKSTIVNSSTNPLTISSLVRNDSGTIKTTGAGGLNFAGSATNTGGTITASGSTGPITFAGSLSDSSGQIVAGNNPMTISTLAYNAGAIKTSGTGALNFTNAATNAGVIDGSGGTGAITFGNTLANNAGGTVTSGSGGATFTGAPTNAATITSKNGGLLTFNAAINNTGTIQLQDTAKATYTMDATATGTQTYSPTSTVTYTGTTSRVDSAAYGNLTLANNNKTASKSFSVAGNLALGSKLAMGTNTLTMSDTLGANVSGTGEVDGAVKRTNPINAGEFYTFNNDSVGMALKHASASQLTLTMMPDTIFGPAPSAKYAKRAFSLSGSANTDTLTSLALIYANNELVGVTNKSKLGVKDYNGTTWSKVSDNGLPYTRSIDSINNVVLLAGVSAPLGGITEMGISTTAIQSIASGNWSDSAHVWDDGVVPRATDDVELYSNYVITNDQPGQAASSLTFYNSSVLNINNGMTVNGVVDLSSGLSTLSVANGMTLTIDNLAGGQSFIVNGKIINNGTIDVIK